MIFDTKQLMTASVVGLALCGTAQADTFDGGGDGTSWEDPLNWAADVVPLNNSTPIIVLQNNQVLYDSDTWDYIQTNGLAQSSTQHRIARLLMGDSTLGSQNGTQSVTFDPGAPDREILATNSTSHTIGVRTNKFSTLNIESGIVNLGARTVLGGQVDSSGTVNVNGGTFIVGRSGPQIGLNDGAGHLTINGGAFRTREYVQLGGNGVFEVVGSTPTEIGIGSHASIDGIWDQQAGGILRTGLDAGGVTPIFIDDVDDDGAGLQGNATFASGSILDPYDLGGAATNVWTTVMSWEGTLDDQGLGLSSTAITDGWSMQFLGNELQVMLAGSSSLVGDYNGDGFVSQGDLDLVLLNWGNAVAPAGFDESNLEGGGPFDSLMSQNELDGVLLNWGNGTPPSVAAVPEPTSLALIGLGGLALAGRRRRK